MKFNITVSTEVSLELEVDANNEEEAKEILNRKRKNNEEKEK